MAPFGVASFYWRRIGKVNAWVICIRSGCPEESRRHVNHGVLRWLFDGKRSALRVAAQV